MKIKNEVIFHTLDFFIPTISRQHRRPPANSRTTQPGSGCCVNVRGQRSEDGKIDRNCKMQRLQPGGGTRGTLKGIEPASQSLCVRNNNQKMFASGCEATACEVRSRPRASKPSDPPSPFHAAATQSGRKNKNFTSN